MSVLFKRALDTHIESLKVKAAHSDPAKSKEALAKYNQMLEDPVTPPALRRSLAKAITKLEADVKTKGESAFYREILGQLEAVQRKLEGRPEYSKTTRGRKPGRKKKGE